MLVRLMRIREIAELLGISTITLHRWYKSGAFPEPVRLSPGSIAWRSDTVEDWIANRPGGQVAGS